MIGVFITSFERNAIRPSEKKQEEEENAWSYFNFGKRCWTLNVLIIFHFPRCPRYNSLGLQFLSKISRAVYFNTRICGFVIFSFITKPRTGEEEFVLTQIKLSCKWVDMGTVVEPLIFNCLNELRTTGSLQRNNRIGCLRQLYSGRLGQVSTRNHDSLIPGYFTAV